MTERQEDGKSAKSFRLSAEAVRLLEALSQNMGISQTSVLELVIREEAGRRGLRDGAE